MEQLADMAGVKSWQTVQQWEKNTAPKRTRAASVANALGVSENYLLTGEDKQKPGINRFVDKSRYDKTTEEVIELMHNMTDIGKMRLLERAHMLAETYPTNKQKTSFR